MGTLRSPLATVLCGGFIVGLALGMAGAVGAWATHALLEPASMLAFAAMFTLC